MIAETAAALNTPLPDLLEMEIGEIRFWHGQAVRILRAKQGNQ